MEYINETGLPSVTDIMSPWIDRRWFKDYHQQRGRMCHDVMACHALELPFLWKNFNTLWNPYVDSGRIWFDKNVRQVLMVEQRLQVQDYCGQEDLLCELVDGRIALVDWKTSQATYKYWPFQTGGYQYLIESNTDYRINIRMCVRLRNEAGRDVLVSEHKDSEYDIGIFNCAKAMHYAMK